MNKQDFKIIGIVLLLVGVAFLYDYITTDLYEGAVIPVKCHNCNKD